MSKQQGTLRPLKMGRPVGEGLRSYYKAKIEELEIQARDKQHNLRRLEGQRNDLNGKGKPGAILIAPYPIHDIVCKAC